MGAIPILQYCSYFALLKVLKAKAASELSVSEVDVYGSRKKDLSNVDKGQIVLSRGFPKKQVLGSVSFTQ